MQVNEQQQRALLLLVNSNNGVEKPCLGVGAKTVKVKGLCLEPWIFKNCNTFYFVTYSLLKLQ